MKSLEQGIWRSVRVVSGGTSRSETDQHAQRDEAQSSYNLSFDFLTIFASTSTFFHTLYPGIICVCLRADSFIAPEMLFAFTTTQAVLFDDDVDNTNAEFQIGVLLNKY